MQEFVLGLSDVRKSFGAHAAVDGVSLDVRGGEYFSVLGPSGCGKTTLLRLIAGFEFCDRGTITMAGSDVTTLPARRRPVNLVFQQYALFPHLTVGQNVAFGLEMQKRPRSEIRQRVADALQSVHLDGLDGRHPAQLSGGQQQRVALARALVNRPRVLLLDEPLGALDLKLRRAMQAELKALQRELGITFVHVTHDQHEALAMSDRIAVMRDGHIEQVDSPQGIYDRPNNLFVADFIGDATILRGHIARVDNTGTRVMVDGTEYVASPVVGAVAGQEAAIVIRPEHIHFAQRSGDGQLNRRTGTVIDREYLGADVRYRIRLDDRNTITMLESARGRSVDQGDAVEVTWSSEHGHIIVTGSSNGP